MKFQLFQRCLLSDDAIHIQLSTNLKRPRVNRGIHLSSRLEKTNLLVLFLWGNSHQKVKLALLHSDRTCCLIYQESCLLGHTSISAFTNRKLLLLPCHAQRRAPPETELIVFIQIKLLLRLACTWTHVELCTNLKVHCLKAPVTIRTIKVVRRNNVESSHVRCGWNI